MTASSAWATTPGQYTPIAATGSQSISITNNGNHADTSGSGIGTKTLSLDDVTGSATSAAGGGSASISLKQGGGGGLGGGLGGNASANARAHTIYQYVFTATVPGLVQSIMQGGAFGVTSCSAGIGATCQLQQTTSYIANATSITGSYNIAASGYADGTVSANGYGPTSTSAFTQACGYGHSSTPGCSFGSASGTFSILGVLAVNSASLSANSFYGFIDLDTTGRLFEGGQVTTFIDPMVSLNLPGVDPNNFILSLSPGFTSGAVSAVPEPAAWTMMILGLGAIGASLRRRAGRRVQPA